MTQHVIGPEALARAVEERSRAAGPNERLVRELTWVAGVAGGAVALVGLGATLGWVLGVGLLIRVAPGLVTMKFATATCLIAAGSAIALAAYAQLTGAAWALRAAVALMVAVGFVALATLVEDALGVRSGLDNPFGLDPGDPHTAVAGRMALMTALSLTGLTAAVVLTARNLVRAAQVVALCVSAIGAAGVVGYAYGLEALYRLGPYDSVAVHSAAAIMVAGVATLFLRPGDGFVSMLVGNTAGGLVVRRLLPWVLAVPAVCGMVVVAGLRHGSYDGSFALAVLVTVVTTTMAALVWYEGEQLREVDLRRCGAEDALAVAGRALAERDRIQHDMVLSERRTRSILSTAADAYLAVGPDGRITEWNDAAIRLFGWTRSEAVGVAFQDLVGRVSGGDPNRVVGRRWRSGDVVMTGRPVELEVTNRSGARIDVEVTLWAGQEPVVGGFRAFHAFIRDIAERKRAERELREANADLSEFAAVAAHDLRSPLATIKMQVELILAELEEDPTSPEVAAWLARIQNTAARGVDMVDDLLAFVSIGRETRTFRRVELDPLARKVAEQELSSSDRAGTCSVAPLPAVLGDEAMLGELLANLIGNALKYAAADRTPHVVVDAVEGGTDRLCVVRVADNGEGFASDETERVFGMFQRGRAASGVPGTGIGLAVCRRVAERHDGRIWIEDAPGGGSRICVELSRWTGPPAETS